MSTRPRFSVVVPTYNRASTFLPQTIEAVLGQSFGDFELLISDNCSQDGTEEYVHALKDPRVRYVRREKTIPAAENFAAGAREVCGEFLILNQDDDLLHRHFLARADAAFAGHPEAQVYASPIWRQVHGHGYHARLMRHRAGHDDVAVIRDEIALFDGPYAAIQFFDPIRHFVHPTLAMRSATVREVGGFDIGSRYQTDLVTQARVLFNGPMLYDPRVGGLCRVHPTNFMRGKPRSFRKTFFRDTYVQLIAAFEAADQDWPSLLRDYLSRLSEKEILGCLHEWTYYRAPVELQKIGFAALKTSSGGARRYYRRCLTKLGPRNLVRHALSRLAQRRG